MTSHFLIGTCVVLGTLCTWNTWTLYQINQRLEVIEQMTPSVSKKISKEKLKEIRNNSNLSLYPKTSRETQQELTPDASKMSANEQGSKQPTFDLMDPEIQEKIAKIAESNAQKKEEQRQKSKMEAYKTSMKYELEKFSTEKEYDTDTVQNIETILDDSTAEWRSVREQVREGEISWIDARTEFKAIGEETEERVTEFISEEDYKELRSRLWGDWGR
jgi:hypothetical protein